MNSNLVIEEITMEVDNYKEVVQIADENKIKVALVDNIKLKQEFLLADNYLSFSQVLIISNISHNCDYDDPFFHYILMITKVIRKAIKRMLVPNSIKTKQEFIVLLIQYRDQRKSTLSLFLLGYQYWLYYFHWLDQIHCFYLYSQEYQRLYYQKDSY
ncbi:unnamed protein product [Paramecium sonneborni]|uniref:Uncharacterized protein n=1 Tax=Paramecium sonneborni TaxID=65129 RepID=A0A8S1KQG4_9CILI|nr:unnamed protein product [Paramecium sonneborni]